MTSTATVVGSGPNGLTAAVALARAGVRVRVLEAADEIGGGLRSEELSPGVVADHCSAFHPLGAASPYLSTLGLQRYGLRWRWADIDCAHPLDDGSVGLMCRDLDRTAAALGADGDRWRALFGAAARHYPRLAGDILGPMIRVPRHPLALAGFGLRAMTPATVLVRTLHTPAARALLMGVAAHAMTRLDRVGSSAAATMLIAAGHHSGWPAAEGGSVAIANALAALLTDFGGTIETGVRVTGRTDLGDPDLALLDVTPASAADILGDALPTARARTFRGFPHGPGVAKVDYVIDGEVGWRSAECARAGTVHLGGTAEEIAAAEADVVADRMPDRPFTLVGQQWLADPTRARGTLRPVWAYAHVPFGYAGEVTDVVTAQIERFAPGFAGRVRAVRTLTPADLEAGNPNLVGGDIGNGRGDLWHLLARPRPSAHPYETGVPGVYLCSSATPPGGGVHGMCGAHAARAALAHLDGRARGMSPTGV